MARMPLRVKHSWHAHLVAGGGTEHSQTVPTSWASNSAEYIIGRHSSSLVHTKPPLFCGALIRFDGKESFT